VLWSPHAPLAERMRQPAIRQQEGFEREADDHKKEPFPTQQ
jgi:hypothetical protein